MAAIPPVLAATVPAAVIFRNLRRAIFMMGFLPWSVGRCSSRRGPGSDGRLPEEHEELNTAASLAGRAPFRRERWPHPVGRRRLLQEFPVADVDRDPVQHLRGAE